MASSKTFLLLGLVFAVVLLISSSVSARELAEAAQTQENVQTEAVEEANYGDLNGRGHGHGHRGSPPGPCCGSPPGRCC
ncbi:glycine-rich protein HC1-like [Corylus avellana]|uniref:glycine-rich protein HC1-like n=1 Tax=Corylus avellana TaxID=13451 RepID=UPI001E236036|nr:glycine-rich protein HC1-like [Corylus avellana]